MFENRNHPLISRRRFAFRVTIGFSIAVAIDATALGIGAIGFHTLEGMDWLLACTNAAMVITGNGMVSHLHVAAGRIFSIFYALFGVLAFICVTGVILAPVFHRILHTFHVEVPGKPE